MREHKSYKELGVALQSVKRALAICIKMIGEEQDTCDFGTSLKQRKTFALS